VLTQPVLHRWFSSALVESTWMIENFLCL
jgi:hypothetical protein